MERSERLPRPSSTVLEVPGLSPSRGINRNQLTLFLSVAAIILSVGSAGVQLYVFFNGGQQKMAAEAELARTQNEKEKALATAALEDAALKRQQIKTAAAQEEEARAAKTNLLASAQNHVQDTHKKVHETISEEAKAYLNGEVLLKSGVVPIIAKSAVYTGSGDPLLITPQAGTKPKPRYIID